MFNLGILLKSLVGYIATVLAVVCIALTSWASDGKDSGGGGGFAHDYFIAAGQRVIYFLSETPRGKEITSRYNLDLCRLKATLDEDLVFVYDTKDGMKDHRGSAVGGDTYRWRIHMTTLLR